jgi:DNA-binding CsgD family transcriptional regulator
MTGLETLTDVQLEVLRQLASGMSAAEIAKDRYVSLSTARTHVKAIMAKLDVHTQLKAVAVYHEHQTRPLTNGEVSEIDSQMNEHMNGHSISNNIGYMACNAGCRTHALKRIINSVLAERKEMK